jgi:hypothetical protein
MRGEGLEVGQQLENIATDGNGMIKIGAPGGDSVPATGAYQARTSRRTYGSTGFTCSSNSN